MTIIRSSAIHLANIIRDSFANSQEFVLLDSAYTFLKEILEIDLFSKQRQGLPNSTEMLEGIMQFLALKVEPVRRAMLAQKSYDELLAGERHKAKMAARRKQKRAARSKKCSIGQYTQPQKSTKVTRTTTGRKSRSRRPKRANIQKISIYCHFAEPQDDIEQQLFDAKHYLQQGLVYDANSVLQIKNCSNKSYHFRLDYLSVKAEIAFRIYHKKKHARGSRYLYVLKCYKSIRIALANCEAALRFAQRHGEFNEREPQSTIICLHSLLQDLPNEMQELIEKMKRINTALDRSKQRLIQQRSTFKSNNPRVRKGLQKESRKTSLHKQFKEALRATSGYSFNYKLKSRLINTAAYQIPQFLYECLVMMNSMEKCVAYGNGNISLYLHDDLPIERWHDVDVIGNFPVAILRENGYEVEHIVADIYTITGYSQTLFPVKINYIYIPELVSEKVLANNYFHRDFHCSSGLLIPAPLAEREVGFPAQMVNFSEHCFADLKMKIIRPLLGTNTYQRDPRRTFRAIKLITKYGFTFIDEEVDCANIAACDLSFETYHFKLIRKDLEQLLSFPDTYRVLELLFKMNLLPGLFLSGPLPVADIDIVSVIEEAEQALQASAELDLNYKITQLCYMCAKLYGIQPEVVISQCRFFTRSHVNPFSLYASAAPAGQQSSQNSSQAPFAISQPF